MQRQTLKPPQASWHFWLCAEKTKPLIQTDTYRHRLQFEMHLSTSLFDYAYRFIHPGFPCSGRFHFDHWIWTTSKKAMVLFTLNSWFWHNSSNKHVSCLLAHSMEHPPVIKETKVVMERWKATENKEPGISERTGNITKHCGPQWDIVNYSPPANYYFISAHSNPADICCLSFYVMIGLNDCE